MNIAKKVILVVMIMMILLNVMQGFTMAAGISWDSITNSAKGFINKGEKNGSNTFSDQDIEDLTVPLAKILTAVGTIVIIIVIIVLGIKYSMATPDEAAKLKQQLIGVVVAGGVIFGAVMIWRIMYDIMDNVEKNM